MSTSSQSSEHTLSLQRTFMNMILYTILIAIVIIVSKKEKSLLIPLLITFGLLFVFQIVQYFVGDQILIFSVAMTILGILIFMMSIYQYLSLFAQDCTKKSIYTKRRNVVVTCFLLFLFFFLFYFGKHRYTQIRTMQPHEIEVEREKCKYLLWGTKLTFVGIVIALVSLNRYTDFAFTSSNKLNPTFIYEILVMLACGFVAGIFQVMLMKKCFQPSPLLKMSGHVLMTMILSVVLYLIFEFSGLNAYFFTENVVTFSITSQTSCGVIVSTEGDTPLQSVGKRLDVQLLLLLLSLSMIVMVGIFTYLGSNIFGLFDVDGIQNCLDVESDQRQYGKGILIFVVYWFMWALVLNSGYLYVRVNRNNGQTKSLSVGFLFEMLELTIKLWFIGCFMGILSSNQRKKLLKT